MSFLLVSVEQAGAATTEYAIPSGAITIAATAPAYESTSLAVPSGAVAIAGGTPVLAVSWSVTAGALHVAGVAPTWAARWDADAGAIVIAAVSPATSGMAAEAIWTLEIWSLDGSTQLVAPASFLTARITWALEGPHAAEIELDRGDMLASGSGWRFGERRVKLRDPAGVVRFQGWLDRVERFGPPSDIRYRASARGLAGALDYGVVHTEDGPLSVTDSGQAVAWALIENVQAQENSMWNFSLGTFHGGESSSKKRRYHEGDPIATAINQLAALVDNGFDYDIDEDGNFDTWVPVRGIDRTGTVEFGEADTMDFALVGDFTDAATYVTAVGSTGRTATASDDTDVVLAGVGRREVSIDVPDEDDDELADRAHFEIRSRVRNRRVLHAAWLEGLGPWDFGDVWLGDAVKIREGIPFRAEEEVVVLAFRLTTITLTLEPGRHAFVETEWARVWPEAEGMPTE